MTTPQKSNSSSSKKWKPTATTEAKKLGSTEADWNLAGSISSSSRRQGRSTRRRLLQSPPPPSQLVCSPCNSHTDGDASTTVSSLTDGSSSSKRRTRPRHSRVIVEVNPMVAMLQKYLLKCPACKNELILSFPTTCLATSCRLECVNKGACTFAEICKPALADNIPLAEDAGSALIERNTDYAVNVLYVLGFIASGDGGTEASRLLGLVGLPNSTTMQSRSFGNIEKELSPVLQHTSSLGQCEQIEIWLLLCRTIPW